MRIPKFACIALLGTAALPFAIRAAVPVSDKASNITPENTHSTIAPGAGHADQGGASRPGVRWPRVQRS